MSYDFPRYIRTHSFTWAQGGGDLSRGFLGPKGMKGRLIDYGYTQITTTFAGATTTPSAKVGITGSLASVGVLFDGSTTTTTVAHRSVLSTYSKLSDIATYILSDGALAADTTYFLTHVDPTGSGAAGAATCFAMIHWGA